MQDRNHATYTHLHCESGLVLRRCCVQVGCARSRDLVDPRSVNCVGPGTMCDLSTGTWTRGEGTLHYFGAALLLAIWREQTDLFRRLQLQSQIQNHIINQKHTISQMQTRWHTPSPHDNEITGFVKDLISLLPVQNLEFDRVVLCNL